MAKLLYLKVSFVTDNNTVGLFLGAGASYELGMPLVWHLTGEFKGYFTPHHIRELNVGWRQQGGGFDDSVINTAIELLTKDNLHYENILGCLQTLAVRYDQPYSKQYHHLYQKMVEILYILLFHRQCKSLPYIQRGFPPFEGLVGFVKQCPPVWVFSLNHDVIFQLLAQHFNIPLRDGFWPNKILTISGNKPDTERITLHAEILSEEDLNKGDLHYFTRGETGVNLMRLHGSIDIFTFRNGLDLCRLLPTGPELNGLPKAISLLNEDISYWTQGEELRPTNEIVFADEYGNSQFLRRTLLAGAQKFDKRFHQTLPQKMLDSFRSHINNVQKLYIIGYSFGDSHIDSVIRDWLQFSSSRSIVIVDPTRKHPPAHFAHLSLQIEVISKSASDFFTEYRQAPLTRLEKLEQRLRAFLRPAIEKKAAKKW